MPEPWGGHRNGRIPRSELEVVTLAENSAGDPVSHHRLRRDAALALDRILAMMPAGSRYVTDTYRDYATQVRLKEQKGRYAATPGTSNHGWAMAADCAYSHHRGAARWMWENEGACREHGWFPPAWTHDGRGIEEPWHWEYDHTLDQHRFAADDSAGDDMIIPRGAKGEHVAGVQRLVNGVNGRAYRLDAAAYGNHPGLSVDGDYGQATAAAISHALGVAAKARKVDLHGDPAQQVTAPEVSVLAECVAWLGDQLAAAA